MSCAANPVAFFAKLASAAAVTLALLLSLGCYQPQHLPPPTAIPDAPDGLGPDLVGPNSPPATITPPIVPPEKTFAWPADVPLKEWRYIVLHHTASDSGSVDSIHAEHQQRKDSEGN